MAEFSLLFAPDKRLLGEMVTSGGAFTSLTLSSAGEEALGDHVYDWQIHGVPVLHDRIPETFRSVYQLDTERVHLRDAAFLAVLRVLLDARSIVVITLPPQRVLEWQQLAAARLTDSQRFKKICVPIV